jgi:NADH:ubiquinone oxidoreductase subunit 4 (subunit M)
VALAAYYALRLYIGTMHNRRPDGILSREIGLRDGIVLAPLVLCILALALYPQLILHRADPSVQKAVAAVTGAPETSPTKAEREELAADIENGWKGYAPVVKEKN